MEQQHERAGDYFTVAEVAKELRVSRKTVRERLIKCEGLPAYNFGDRAYRIPVAEFREWRESRRVSGKEAS